MTALDWIFLSIVGISALLGLMRGLIGIAISLAAWLLAGIAAWMFGADVGRGLGGGGDGSWGEYLAGYALSFAVVWIAVGLLGLVVRRLAHSAGLSGIDRLFGFSLGLVRGVILACALVLLLGLTRVPGTTAWRESAGVAMLLPGAAWMRSMLPPRMQERMDLEGRGTSLQAMVEDGAGKLQQGLPDGLPALPQPVEDAIQEGVLRQARAEPAARERQTDVPRQPATAGQHVFSGQPTSDAPSDEALVH